MSSTDEDAALAAIATLDPLSAEQQRADDEIKHIRSNASPFVNIHDLFKLYNTLYFRSLLVPRVEVSWSSRLTLCAGICELVRNPNDGNRYSRIRLKLSEPLLKYRPRSDVLDTLLHEAIHAYFFVTTSWRHSRGDDGSGHGAGFLLLADAINDHGGYEVTVFHTFHDEVDSCRTHVWQCEGSCREHAPHYGLVKRSMNRAPGQTDVWWKQHQTDCGGLFVKISEPEMTKKQMERLRGLERAGKQKQKIDSFFQRQLTRVEHSEARRKSETPVSEETRTQKRSGSPLADDNAKRVREFAHCPICQLEMTIATINEHIDHEHPP